MEDRGWSPLRLVIGAGLLAAAVVGVAAFVPKRRLVSLSEAVAGPLRLAANAASKSPLVNSVAAWAVDLWNDAGRVRAPMFDDLRPFDEF